MIHLNGVPIAFDRTGTGPALVFLHAGVADRRQWRHAYDALKAGYDVTRYDAPGHGDSGDPPRDHAPHRTLLALMDALGIERAALIGNSMGAAYAAEAALAAPERVTALVLISPGLSGHTWPPEMLAQVRERVHSAVPAAALARYARGAAVPDPAHALALARAHTRWQVAGPGRTEDDLDPRVWALAVDMLQNVFQRTWTRPKTAELPLEPPAAGRLHTIAAPTLVINGLADVPGIQEVAGLYHSRIPGARRLDLPATGHLPPLERPHEVTGATAAFLQEVLPSR
ncbi:alpha/beta fold hydrolase [Nonomuraea typhae]|uniref:alpha/beta fold hydrolase n=1 Tax=Nonomuraea typhae TaxID=2603600 RepID=UPI0012F82CD4|nr:alpha/beta fold hydrolase [Nonomuraea typhae]